MSVAHTFKTTSLNEGPPELRQHNIVFRDYTGSITRREEQKSMLGRIDGSQR